MRAAGVSAANGMEQRAAIAGAGKHWAKTFNRVFQASSYLQSCDHHGAAAHPSRRHRDPAAELEDREGRGAWNLPQPLKPRLHSAPQKPCGRGHYLATVTFTAMNGPFGRAEFAAIFKHSLR